MSRQTADSLTATEWPALQARQDASLAARGQYAQERPTTHPDGTVTECHVYDGPSGKGYCLILRATDGGKTYLRVLHEGPEAHRDAHDAWVERVK